MISSYKTYLILIILLAFVSAKAQQKMPPSIEKSKNEPVKYAGEIQTQKKYYDGSLPHAVGVHHFQALRANRTDPDEPGLVGWTYNHQPYLAYWNNKFYLQYLSGKIQEHTPPTRTLVMTSVDGMTWTDPFIVFPEYSLPEIHIDGEYVPAGTKSVMHQRMGFYVAPNGKLLTLGFYSYCPTPYRSPNAGTGLGRVVREIKKDGTMNEVYFIRYNRHAGWNETNTNFPFYTKSKNKEFVQACDDLLADKLITLQWWEEDRAEDGFYTIDPSKVPGGDSFHRRTTTSKGAGKAFNFYQRPDGVTVGIWKNQFAALSPDKGSTWTEIAKNPTLWTTGAKTWGQKTEDNCYVIVHNQSATRRNRFPLAAMVGGDGHIFTDLVCLTGEIPPRRYQGLFKNPGAQYVRGIIQGNGNPPGNELWITYSMNKEDIWISKVRVPIISSVEDEVIQNFDNVYEFKDLKLWNIYISKWAPINIVEKKDNRFLRLSDEEPYDYALAERIFPESSEKTIEFSFRAPRLPQGCASEIEVQTQRHGRALRVRIDKDWLYFDIEKVTIDPVKIDPAIWNHVVLVIDTNQGYYSCTINGKKIHDKIELNDNVTNVERIVFRTGPFRGHVPAAVVENGIEKQSGFYSEDLLGADSKAPLIILDIDNIKTY